MRARPACSARRTRRSASVTRSTSQSQTLSVSRPAAAAAAAPAAAAAAPAAAAAAAAAAPAAAVAAAPPAAEAAAPPLVAIERGVRKGSCKWGNACVDCKAQSQLQQCVAIGCDFKVHAMCTTQHKSAICPAHNGSDQHSQIVDAARTHLRAVQQNVTNVQRVVEAIPKSGDPGIDVYKKVKGVPGWCYSLSITPTGDRKVTRSAQRCEGSSKIVDSVIAKKDEASSLGSLFCTTCRLFVCNLCLSDVSLQAACPACSVKLQAGNAKKISALSRVLRCSGHGVCSKDLTVDGQPASVEQLSDTSFAIGTTVVRFRLRFFKHLSRDECEALQMEIGLGKTVNDQLTQLRIKSRRSRKTAVERNEVGDFFATLTEEKNVPGKERQHLAVFVGKACHVHTKYNLSVTEMYIGSTSHRKVPPPHTHKHTPHFKAHHISNLVLFVFSTSSFMSPLLL